MLITEVVTFLDTLRGLAQRKSELDREYFKDFLEPTWEMFNRVHAAYLSSLKEYNDLLSKEDVDLNALLTKITLDTEHLANIRVELFKLVKYMPSGAVYRREVDVFKGRISRYFELAGFFINRESGYIFIGRDRDFGRSDYSPIRIPLIIRISRKQDLEDARHVIRGIRNKLQSNYSEAADTFYQLKGATLS